MSKLLKDKRVLVSRPEPGLSEFKKKLEWEGAKVISLPLIGLRLKADLSDLYQAFSEFEKFDWVVFNSSAAVRFFFEAAEKFGLRFLFYPEIKFATVGEKTKATLEQIGYRTNFVPIKYTAEVLAENMPEVEGKNILIPASELTEGTYLKAFEKRGALAKVVHTYENYRIDYTADELAERKIERADYLTFTSGSTVNAFNELYPNPELFDQAKWVYIGPSTAKTAKELKLKIDAIADPHTLEGMINSMKKLEENV